MIKAEIDIPMSYFSIMERKMNQNAEEALTAAARLTCQKLATATFPTGVSGKTFETLKKAIYKDMANAYITTDSIRATDDGTYLLRHRNHKGRVPEGTQRKSISRADYEDIKKKFEKHAGMAKAGWLQAANELGRTRVPVWLRKTQDLASVQKTGLTIIVTNKVKYASNLITDSQIRNAMINSFRGLIKRAERQIAK